MDSFASFAKTGSSFHKNYITKNSNNNNSNSKVIIIIIIGTILNFGISIFFMTF